MRFGPILLIAIFFKTNAFATELSVKQGFGRSSQALILEEEEDDGRFSFWSTEIKLEQGDDKAKTNLAVLRREKDFKTRPSDMLTNQAAINARRKQAFYGENVTLGGGFNWRARSFRETPKQNYQEMSGTLFGQNYLGWEGRVKATHYAFKDLDSENKLGLSVKKSLPLNNFTLSGNADMERHWAQNRQKFKPEAGASTIWKPESPHWSHARLAVEGGRRDTKSLDEREDNLDFSFWKIETNSTHPLNDAHDLAWKFWLKEKDDTGGLYTHHGYSGTLEWRWHLGRGLGLSGINPSIEIKKMKFTELPILTYNKQALGIGARGAWMGWKFGGLGRVDFYNFTNQKTRHAFLTLGADAAKSLAEGVDLSVGADLRRSLVSFNAGLALSF